MNWNHMESLLVHVGHGDMTTRDREGHGIDHSPIQAPQITTHASLQHACLFITGRTRIAPAIYSSWIMLGSHSSRGCVFRAFGENENGARKSATPPSSSSPSSNTRLRWIAGPVESALNSAGDGVGFGTENRPDKGNPAQRRAAGAEMWSILLTKRRSGDRHRLGSDELAMLVHSEAWPSKIGQLGVSEETSHYES